MNDIYIRKGKAIVDSVEPVSIHSDIALFEIDMTTKWCIEGCHGSENEIPFIGIIPTDRSYSSDKNRENMTEIHFMDFRGWTIVTASISRYTGYVCLIKIEEDD